MEISTRKGREGGEKIERVVGYHNGEKTTMGNIRRSSGENRGERQGFWGCGEEGKTTGGALNQCSGEKIKTALDKFRTWRAYPKKGKWGRRVGDSGKL